MGADSMQERLVAKDEPEPKTTINEDDRREESDEEEKDDKKDEGGGFMSTVLAQLFEKKSTETFEKDFYSLLVLAFYKNN